MDNKEFEKRLKDSIHEDYIYNRECPEVKKLIIELIGEYEYSKCECDYHINIIDGKNQLREELRKIVKGG